MNKKTREKETIKVVNDILAIVNKNALWVIELKSDGPLRQIAIRI